MDNTKLIDLKFEFIGYELTVGSKILATVPRGSYNKKDRNVYHNMELTIDYVQVEINDNNDYEVEFMFKEMNIDGSILWHSDIVDIIDIIKET